MREQARQLTYRRIYSELAHAPVVPSTERREEIERQVAEYLAAGGKIHRVDRHVGAPDRKYKFNSGPRD